MFAGLESIFLGKYVINKEGIFNSIESVKVGALRVTSIAH